MIQSVIRAEDGLTESDYLLRPNVIFLLIQDGSARLLDLAGNFYAISRIGAEMLSETLKFGATAAARHIASEYQTELAQVERDLQAFLRDLAGKRLISHAPQARLVPQSRGMWPSWMLLPLLHCIAALPLSLDRKAWLLLALAFLSIHLFGWPRTIAIWHQHLRNYAPNVISPNEGRASRVHGRAKAGPSFGLLKRSPDELFSQRESGEIECSAQDIDVIVRSVAARHILQVECKERALTCWWLLHALGIPAKLVLGVSVFPLECHCWCEAGSLVLSDDAERCAQFMPILNYDVA